MTIFLLIISFIIDGILLIGLFTLSTRIKKAEELELRQQEIAREIEGMFSSYLLEIKEENRRMSEWMKEKPSSPQEGTTKEDRKRVEEANITEGAEEDLSDDTDDEYAPPVPDSLEAVYQPSVPSQILDLREKGYSLNEIAKELGRGKTEIELLLKFHQKK